MGIETDLRPPTKRETAREDSLAHSPEAQKGRPRRAQQIPELWSPLPSEANQTAEAEARQKGVDLVMELVKLHDWARSKGVARKDWNAQWRNWLRGARPTLAIGSWPGQKPARTLLARAASDEPDLSYDPNKS